MGSCKAISCCSHGYDAQRFTALAMVSAAYPSLKRHLSNIRRTLVEYPQ